MCVCVCVLGGGGIEGGGGVLDLLDFLSCFSKNRCLKIAKPRMWALPFRFPASCISDVINKAGMCS